MKKTKNYIFEGQETILVKDIPFGMWMRKIQPLVRRYYNKTTDQELKIECSYANPNIFKNKKDMKTIYDKISHKKNYCIEEIDHVVKYNDIK